MPNDSEIHIRRASPADIDNAWRTWQNHLNWLNVAHGLDVVLQRRINKEFVESLFKLYPSAVAELDGIVIGFLCTEVREIGIIEIMNFYVDDQFRDQGIGLAMLKLAEDQCHERGVGNLVAFACDRYYPGKQFPTNVFKRAGYDVTQIGPFTEMYLRQVPLSEEAAHIVHPVRRTTFLTIEDIENDKIGYGRVFSIRIDDEEKTTDIRTQLPIH
jgi:N-acetylglutamate synthase-like GNAT family acetyltransferase